MSHVSNNSIVKLSDFGVPTPNLVKIKGRVALGRVGVRWKGVNHLLENHQVSQVGKYIPLNVYQFNIKTMLL